MADKDQNQLISYDADTKKLFKKSVASSENNLAV
jgi:hypothetical protein